MSTILLSLEKIYSMEKTILFLLATCGVLSAQTTVTKAFNDPIIGDMINGYTVNGTVDNSATGNGVTFNNTSLTQGMANNTTYQAPTATEISTFPGSNIKMVATGNTILYKSSASKLEITGVVTSDATLNFSADNGTFITYPAAYGHSESDNARGTFSSTTASGLFKGTITTTSDAYGTLLVGSKTYTNVIRIKSVQNFNLYQSTDITYLFPIGNITNTAYSYYDATHKFPILSSTNGNLSVPLLSINQTTSGAQVLSEVYLAAMETVKKDNFKIYPNPAQDFIEFKGNTGKYSTAHIYTSDGRLIKTVDITSGRIQVSELPEANYFIEVSGKEGKSEAVKFIKK
ncbi:putative secreted protein (Por secretion system target) [Chryseobacterium daecheongense]|uniref:Secreted protein (Por secretion system target) n=2 Tax=Chryseobacterium daecheongense TaxID=192389 RepID=A0ABY2FSE7_9FLAO|nr:putative secreted protein (Por secretion system target) [Chryseobacterium daecheongense]